MTKSYLNSSFFVLHHSLFIKKGAASLRGTPLDGNPLLGASRMGTHKDLRGVGDGNPHLGASGTSPPTTGRRYHVNAVRFFYARYAVKSFYGYVQ